MALLRSPRWSFVFIQMVTACFVIFLENHCAAALATENAQSKMVRQELDESAADPPKPGKWLFGSLSMAQDKLPVDTMLPHQLRNSVARKGFDHVILYTSNKGSNKDRVQQEEVLHRLQKQNVVDEWADVDKVYIDWGTATSVISKDSAEKLFKAKGNHDENMAQVAFLIKCMTQGYDHCAWLDSDVFVHRGTVGWMELAVLDVNRRPTLAISLPSFGRYPGRVDTFTSRHYAYHTKPMKKLLPLTNVDDFTVTFEEAVQQKIDSMPKAKDPEKIILYQTRSPHAWVIHRPSDQQELDHIMTRCSSQDLSLKAVVDIVEKGHHTRSAQSPTLWRKKDSASDMDADQWGPRVEDHCSKVLLARGDGDNGAEHQWRPFKKWGKPKKF